MADDRKIVALLAGQRADALDRAGTVQRAAESIDAVGRIDDHTVAAQDIHYLGYRLLVGIFRIDSDQHGVRVKRP